MAVLNYCSDKFPVPRPDDTLDSYWQREMPGQALSEQGEVRLQLWASLCGPVLEASVPQGQGLRPRL